MMFMGRRLASANTAVATGGAGTAPLGTGDDDEAKVRSYLRLLVDAPVRTSDRLDPAEQAFVEAAARWSARSGVDRRTLTDLGVPRKVLDAAGIAATPVAELVRRQYGKTPFSSVDLVRRSGVSQASVRTVLAEDEKCGRITRVPSEGRAIHYRMR